MNRLAFIFLTLLASCSFLPEPGAETKKFTLEPLPLNSVEKHKLDPIIVDQPTVYPPIDQTRVAIKPTSSTIDYIAGIEWADRLGVLIHENMIQSMQNSGIFQSVGRLNSGLDGKYLLTLDVRKFAKAEEDCCAEVEYFAQISTLQDRKTVANQIFNAKSPLESKDEAGVMDALNRANQDIVLQILNWTKAHSKS